MHILSLLTILALANSSIALPPLLRPSNTSTPNLLTLNATPKKWPKVPWTYAIDESATVSIEYYGRHVCSGDLKCEQRVTDGIDQISGSVDHGYRMGHEEVNSFTSDVVSFWIRQETMVPKNFVEELVATLHWFALEYGTTEVTHAGLLNYGTLAATFELTFPGIED